MTKAYSYIRMSTLQQAKGASLSRQLEATKKFAEKQSWELITSFHDIGVSAYRGNNANEGALGQFIVACEQGRVEKGSFLIVEDGFIPKSCPGQTSVLSGNEMVSCRDFH